MPDKTQSDPRASMTRDERIRATTRTFRTLQTALWVADEIEVSVRTAQKYLDQLVEDSALREVEQGDQALYCVNQLMTTCREVVVSQREHSHEGLTSVLDSIRGKITGWKQSYDIETPGKLRASIADLNDADEVEIRREVASEWEHLVDRVPVI